MDDEDRYTRITLRIPKDLHQVLVAAADRTSKSLNAEIVGRLQASIPEDSETRALEVLPEQSSIRDDLVDALRELSALRSEKAVYELRLDMAAATGKPIPGLKEFYARLRFVKLQIERCEHFIEEFKAEAIEAYGAAPNPKTAAESGGKTKRAKKPSS